MTEPMTTDPSDVLSELDELVDHLSASRARAAAAFATEMFFFGDVARLVERRERERAARAGRGSVTHASQLAMREVFAEIAAALRLSEWQVARKVSLATTLQHQFQETLYEAGDGRLSPEHAALIAETGMVIDDDTVRREYEAVALDMAKEMTSAQLKAALAGLVSRLDPEGTEQRVRDAVKRRRVAVREVEPGLARVTADVPTAQGVGIVNRLRAMAEELFAQNEAEQAEHDAQVAAREAAAAAEEAGAEEAAAEKTVGEKTVADESAADSADVDDPADDPADDFVADERTTAQLMADMFCDLLLTGAVDGHGAADEARDALSSIRATVQVTVPATSLSGHTVGGGEVTGYGAVDDDTARCLAAMTSSWVRVFTDPCTGVPQCVDRYRPSKRQRLFLRVRDVQCRFPGCRRPAVKCDIDHTIPYAEGGPTCLCNLEHLCQRHHTVKHETDWRVEQLAGGILRWTAPTGRTHLARPPGTVRFRPDGVIDPDFVDAIIAEPMPTDAPF